MKRLVRIRGWAAGSVLAVACAISPGSVAHALGDVAPSMSPVADDGPDIRALMAVHPLHLQARHRTHPAANRPVVAILSPCRAYGTVLIPGSSWLGGLGVDVMSNGGTGADCYNTGAGHRWQCGELINRFLAARGWAPAIGGNAGQFYANASGAFDKHPIGSGYLPVPGDVVVWSGGAGGGFGHAAIVVGDGGGRLTVVEQNSTITGYGSFAIDSSGSIGPTGGLTPVGYLHAKANPNQPPPAPAPSSAAPAPKPSPAPHHASGGTSNAPAPSSAPTPSRTPSPTPTPTSTPTPTPTATSSSSGLGGLLGVH